VRGLAFRVLLLLCVLSSTAQGYIAQTHVHSLVAAVAGQSGADASLDAPPGDEATCVLCDVAGHSPSLAPPVVADSLTVASVSRLLLPVARPAVLAIAPSHHWSGRGPPSV